MSVGTGKDRKVGFFSCYTYNRWSFVNNKIANNELRQREIFLFLFLIQDAHCSILNTLETVCIPRQSQDAYSNSKQRSGEMKEECLDSPKVSDLQNFNQHLSSDGGNMRMNRLKHELGWLILNAAKNIALKAVRPEVRGQPQLNRNCQI